MKKTLLLLLVLTAPALAPKIYVTHSGDDIVGGNFAFALKQRIRVAPGYELADVKDNAITIELISLDIQDGNPGYYSAISVLANIPDGLTELVLYHNLLLVGRIRIDDMATRVLAEVDKNLSETRAAFKALQESDPQVKEADDPKVKVQ